MECNLTPTGCRRRALGKRDVSFSRQLCFSPVIGLALFPSLLPLSLSSTFSPSSRGSSAVPRPFISLRCLEAMAEKPNEERQSSFFSHASFRCSLPGTQSFDH